MTLDKQIAKIASLIGDKTRSSILIALMEGRALTAGELALRADISPQTASNHLNKLLNANLIICESAGRHRYYKIATLDVAKILETLSLLTDVPEQAVPRHNKLDKDICFARSCYDHLAGRLGVKITLALITNQYISLHENNFLVSEKGKAFFNKMDIHCDDLLGLRRQFAKPCLDWTERNHHLAGSLGAALLNYFINEKLLTRSKHKPRVVHLTTKGHLWLRDMLWLEIA